MSAPTEAWPIRAGQKWRDRDKRSPWIVTVIRVEGGRVHYARHGRDASSKIERFPRRFDFLSNPL